MWAGTIPPRELVGGRTSDQVNGQTSRSILPHLVVLPTSLLCCPNSSPCCCCLTDLSLHPVATSLLCRSTPSPHHHRHCYHCHCCHCQCCCPRIATSAAVALASLPPLLLPSCHRHHRCCPHTATAIAVALAPPPLLLLPCATIAITVALCCRLRHYYPALPPWLLSPLHCHLCCCHPCIATSTAVTLMLAPPPRHSHITCPLASDATPIIPLFTWVACLPTHLSCLSHATMGMCGQMSGWACGG